MIALRKMAEDEFRAFKKYYTREDDGRYCVFLEDLLIFESERRKGFASAAIREMNELARQDGCASSVLFMRDHNPGGMRLYEKCGYRPYNLKKAERTW